MGRVYRALHGLCSGENMKAAQIIRLTKDRNWWKEERPPAKGASVQIKLDRPLPKSWLSVKQTADRMGVGIWFVYELISARKIEAFQIGRRWKIGKEAVEAFIEAGSNGATPTR